MKVLIVGGGGREHALAWKISQSPLLEELYCAPGNPGIAESAECVDIPDHDIDSLRRFALDKKIDLTVVGPEAPLTRGIVDSFREEGLAVFGPTARGAELEGSKVFAKKLMYKNSIPSAAFKVFESAEDAHQYIDSTPGPHVVKADGLAAGKGVIVTSTPDDAHRAVNMIMVEKEFGDAGETIIIEDRLKGREASVLAFTDGKTVMPLLAAQDHKPVFEGDEGPNTGGMGAYAPAPLITPSLMREIERKVLIPVVHALRKGRREYRGVIYAGMMITPGGPSVLEFNCRFGDPETQPLLMLMKSDLLEILQATAEKKLGEKTLEWEPGAAVCVTMASRGYPGKYEKGKPIEGLDALKGEKSIQVFHAGTSVQDGQLVTNGGRVLGVTARDADIASARAKVYEAVKKVHFEGAHFRRDIAARAYA